MLRQEDGYGMPRVSFPWNVLILFGLVINRDSKIIHTNVEDKIPRA